MKKKIILKRIFHRNEWRYAIFFDYDKNLVGLVKSINGKRWSHSNGCWYANADEETLKQIFAVFRESADIDISAIVSGSETEKLPDSIPVESEKNTIPDTDDQFFTNFPPPVTICKKSDETEDLGQIGPAEFALKESDDKEDLRQFGPVEFAINKSDGRLVIKFFGMYDPEWIKELKSYGRAYYDKIRREWLLHWSQMTVDSLSDYFASRGIKVNVLKIEVPRVVRDLRNDQGAEIRNRTLGKEALNGIEMLRRYLNEKRYSNHTIEAYLALLELFFKYFNTKDPFDITEDDVSAFFHDYIVFHNYSASYQNQVISAIKTFYNLYDKSRINPESLGRPRRRRTLPKVFSKEEIKKILNATNNNKHKLLLWMIYSCGLRRSEVTNIKINDLDRERNILNIREAKGMVDRIVPVPQKVWDKLDEYIAGYKPAFWLFEGQKRGKYSVESVYRVFKEALRKAGIKKEVGVHSLRHSYATHLHENGLDIRYIQELLGHKSTRTTEIYTHVSRRNLVSVRSPIEDIDVK